MTVPWSRYGQSVSATDAGHGRRRATFAGAAICSALLFLVLLTDRTFVQDRFIAQSDDAVPLLKAGETYPLSSASVVTPQLGGDFSLLEEDGVWLLQGVGYLDFQLRDSSPLSSLNVGVGTLPTATRIELNAPSAGKKTMAVLDGASTTLRLEVGAAERQTVSIQCRILGSNVDLGLDIRDLCVKLLWIRIE